jgi:hypothetical protein
MLVFKAAAVAATELADLNAFVVVFAENADGSGERLEVSRALVEDEQSRALGLDTYCLSTEAGATCYGGVASWSLSAGTLEILLDATAAETLGVEGGLRIELNVGREAQEAAKAGLTRVLEGAG